MTLRHAGSLSNKTIDPTKITTVLEQQLTHIMHIIFLTSHFVYLNQLNQFTNY